MNQANTEWNSLLGKPLNEQRIILISVINFETCDDKYN